MNAQPRKKPTHGSNLARLHPGSCLPAVIAAGTVLLTGPAAALELGDLRVNSALGQPLRASIAYALAPNEQLSAYCIYVRGATSPGGLPSVNGVTTDLADGRIVLRGRAPLREPMMSLQVTVDCRYTPHFQRDFLLMLDPASAVAAREPRRRPVAAAAVDTRTATRPAASQRAPAAVRTRPSRAASRAPIGGSAGETYRVQPGETLSGIVARIPNRAVSLWPAVNALFEANPDAFIDGDRDQLRAGAELTVPHSLLGAGQVQPERTPVTTALPQPQPVEAVTGTASPTTTGAVEAPQGKTGVTSPAVEPNPFVEADAGPLDGATAPPAVRPQPVDTVPDTRTDNATVPVPVAGNQVGADSVGSGGSVSWLVFLGGTGIAIILAMLLFGRQIRERLSGVLAATAQPRRRRSDRGEAVADGAAIGDLEDTISRAELSSLDADLGSGSGFDSDPDIDVAEDFSFAASGDFDQKLDFEFGDEPTPAADVNPTDMISPLPQESSVIVDSEVLPVPDAHSDEQTGYDLSMVVDATRQNFGDADATTPDLHAIEVDALDDDMTTGAYTLAEEAGYRLIEQDYEDELTATQALNRDVELAARELAQRLDADAAADPRAIDASDDSATVAIGTAQNVPADRAQDSMAEDLEKTAEVATATPADTMAVNDDGLADTDVTVEMPADQNEATVEMPAERARRRRSKVS